MGLVDISLAADWASPVRFRVSRPSSLSRPAAFPARVIAFGKRTGLRHQDRSLTRRRGTSGPRATAQIYPELSIGERGLGARSQKKNRQRRANRARPPSTSWSEAATRRLTSLASRPKNRLASFTSSRRNKGMRSLVFFSDSLPAHQIRIVSRPILGRGEERRPSPSRLDRAARQQGTFGFSFAGRLADGIGLSQVTIRVLRGRPKSPARELK